MACLRCVCQNAYTSADETVYELLLPIDKPELLQNALKVFAEFATRVVIADDDLDRERGAVLEEWRQGRTAAGRAAEAHWKLVLEGSRYAERLPIGLESVIRKAPASVVRGFYTKWYQPQNMAVVVVGDFPDSDAVVRLLGSTLGQVSACGLFALVCEHSFVRGTLSWVVVLVGDASGGRAHAGACHP